jgi:hypothetical protein
MAMVKNSARWRLFGQQNPPVSTEESWFTVVASKGCSSKDSSFDTGKGSGVMKKAKVLGAALIATLLIVGLVGCGSGASTSNSEQPSSGSGASETDVPAATEPAASEAAESSTFSPVDVSDATIESIQTYDDYLAMFQKIVDDYLVNYEAAIKDTVLYDEQTFAEMREQYNEAFEKQKEEYDSLGNAPLVGKSTLVKYLKDYRDSLKEMTDSVKESLSALS